MSLISSPCHFLSKVDRNHSVIDRTCDQMVCKLCTQAELLMRTLANVRGGNSLWESVVRGKDRWRKNIASCFTIRMIPRQIRTLPCDNKNVSRHVHFYILTIGGGCLLFCVNQVLVLLIESTILMLVLLKYNLRIHQLHLNSRVSIVRYPGLWARLQASTACIFFRGLIVQESWSVKWLGFQTRARMTDNALVSVITNY